jgi:hypothetical protein
MIRDRDPGENRREFQSRRNIALRKFCALVPGRNPLGANAPRSFCPGHVGLLQGPPVRYAEIARA